MTEARSPGAPSRWRRLLARRRNRWLLAVLVLAIAVRVALPYVVRRVAVDQVDKALVGRIELDDVDLALVTGGITLRGLRVFANESPPAPAPPPSAGEGPTGAAPVLSAQRLFIDLGFLALLHKTVEVQRIELEGFAVSLDRAKDGTLVLPRPTPSSEPPNEPAPDGGPGWGVLIQSAMLRDGRIGFRDFTVGDPPQHIEVTLPTVDAAKLALLITERGLEPGKMTLDAGIRDGTLHLEAALENLADGPAVESHVVLTNLPIGDARVYIPNVGWSDLTGRLDTDLVHRFESKGAHTLRGKVGLRDLAIRVKELDDPALAWAALAIEIANVDVVKQHAEIAAVRLDGARVVTRPAGPEPLPVLRGLVAAAKKPGAAKPPPAEAQSAAAATQPAPVATQLVPAATQPAPTTTQPAPAATQPASAEATPAAAGAPQLAPAAESARVDASSGKPWTWTVATTVLKDARVKAIGGDGPLDVGVEAEVANLTSAPGTHSTVHLSLAPASGGTLAVAGDLTLQPIGFDGTLRADGLALAPLTQPIASPETRLLKNGIANIDLEIAAGVTPKAPQDGARFGGKIGLTDLDVAGEDPKVFALRWKELAIELSEVTAPGVLASDASAKPGPIGVALSSLTFTRPEIVVTRTERGIALPEAIGGGASPPADVTKGEAAPPPPAPPVAQATPARPPLEVQVRVDRVAIQKMRVAVTDKTVKPFYRSSLDPIDLTLIDLRWPGPFAKDVKLLVKEVDGATFTLTGDVAPTGSQLAAKLDGLALAPFNPYAVSSGYGVGGGTAQLESQIKLQPGAYDTTSRLVLNKLDVRGGEGDSLFVQRFGMPLSLVLALMTDLQGNIILDLPIAGDAKGTRTGIGTLVGNALARAILNAVTSPLKLIGAVASIGDKPASVTPQPIVFQPGRNALAEGEDKKLDQLGGLLSTAPGLSLHLRGEASAEDRRWLQEQALRAQLEKESGVVGALRHIGERGARGVTLKVLTARAEGKPAEIPEEHRAWFEEQVAAQKVLDAVLQQLAEARAQSVQSQLERGQGVAGNRLFLDAPTPADLAARPVVAIGLGHEAAHVPSGGAEPAGGRS